MYGTQFAQTIPPRSLDSDQSHFLRQLAGSDLTVNRDLTWVTGDSDRQATLQGDPTLDDWFDQSVKIASSPTFAGLVLSSMDGVVKASAGVLAGSAGFSDLAPASADVDMGSFAFTARQLQSDAPAGTAPLIVVSTDLVSNLNADLLDGQHAAAFSLAGHSHTFLNLTDAPSDYTGQANKTVSVKVTEDGLEFTAASGGSTFDDSLFQIYDNLDNTKKLAFEASGIATLTTRTITMPNNDVNLGTDFAAAGHTHALTDLSDVDTTGVSTGNFLQKSAGDWVDFDLFGTGNIWSADQKFTAEIQIGDASHSLSASGADTIYDVPSSGAHAFHVNEILTARIGNGEFLMDQAAAGTFAFNWASNNVLYVRVDGVNKYRFESSAFRPASNGIQEIGSASLAFGKVWANDLRAKGEDAVGTAGWVTYTGTTTQTTGAAISLGKLKGKAETGPATAAQWGWLKILHGSTSAWVPVWR